MTVVNPKSISGINSITMASGSDNLLTIHTTNTTERLRINSSGDVIVGSGITVSPDGNIFATGVTTSTTFVGALTGNVTGNINGDLTGTLQTAAQTNITSVGSLSSLVVTGGITATGGNIVMNDSSGSSANRIKLGTSQDLELYHSGSNSYIKDSGTGYLLVLASGFAVQNAAGSETIMSMAEEGGVDLYYNDTKKLETENEGVVIPSGAGNCLRVFGQNTAHATSALVIGQNSTTVSQLRAYGPDTSTNGEINFRTSRSDGSNSVNLTYNGNLQFASGYGIDFSATSDASGMASELLDDYEEGTFSPNFSGDSGAGSYGYSRQSGIYTKIGNTVYYSFYITTNAVSANASGNLIILGLPFTTGSGNAYYQGASIGYYAGFNNITPSNALCDVNNTRIYIYKNNATSNILHAVPTDVQIGTSLIVSGHYHVA